MPKDPYADFSSAVEDPYASFSSPVQAPSVTKKPKPSDNSALRALALGIAQPFDNVAARMDSLPGMATVNRLASSIGFESGAEAKAKNDRLRAQNSRTGYQTAGNIGGTALMTLATKNPALAGGVGGAALSDKQTVGGVAQDAAVGAIGGKLGSAAVKFAGRLAKPVVSKAATALAAQGVPLTVGQIARAGGSTFGKTIGAIEDKAQSIPVLGDMITSARQKGTEAFMRANLNRAAKPAGLKIGADVAPDKEAIAKVGDALSASYQKILPTLRPAVPDGQYQADSNAALGIVSTASNAINDQYQKIINQVFENRAPGQVLSSKAMKEAESRLTKLAGDYSKSLDPDQRAMGEALAAQRDALRQLVMRQNPQAAAQLRQIDKGWAELATIENAVKQSQHPEGFYTPRQYGAAAQRSDSTVRARATTRGTARNQEFIDAAKGVLPSKTPDSGTAGRVALMGGGAGLGALAATGNLPAVAGLAGSVLPYTVLGQRAVNALAFAPRPLALQRAGNALLQVAPYAGSVAPALLRPGNQ